MHCGQVSDPNSPISMVAHATIPLDLDPRDAERLYEGYYAVFTLYGKAAKYAALKLSATGFPREVQSCHQAIAYFHKLAHEMAADAETLFK